MVQLCCFEQIYRITLPLCMRTLFWTAMELQVTITCSRWRMEVSLDTGVVSIQRERAIIVGSGALILSIGTTPDTIFT